MTIAQDSIVTIHYTLRDDAEPDKKNGGGRPPKFDEPSRPITLTLPESTLEGLRQIDADRGQAVVKLTRGALRTLNHDELQGMAGHEFCHIVEGDLQLFRRMSGLLAGMVGCAVLEPQIGISVLFALIAIVLLGSARLAHIVGRRMAAT